MTPNFAIQEGLIAFWLSSGIDTQFKSLRTSATNTRHLTIHENEAPAGVPMPYAVWKIDPNTVDSRYTSTVVNKKTTLIDFPLIISIHCKNGMVSGSAKNGKEHAQDLAGFVNKCLVGDDDIAPKDFTIPRGEIVLIQYLRDFGIRTGDGEYQHTLEYNIEAEFDSRIS